MLTNDQLRGIYPLIVTPSHDGKFFYNYTLSLLNLQNVSMQLGMPIQFLLQQGESLGDPRPQQLRGAIFGKPRLDTFVLDRFRHRFYTRRGFAFASR